MSNNKESCPIKKTSIGGQALMEGIMMRGPEWTAMAVRNPEGEIVVEKFPTEAKKRAKFFKLPIIRGVFNYIDSMTIGTKCLMRSAEIAGLEDAEDEYKREKMAKKAAKKNGTTVQEELDKINQSENEDAKPEPKEKNDKGTSAAMNAVMFFSVLLGIAFSVFLFIVVPTYLYKLLTLAVPVLKFEDNLGLQSLVKSVFEGVLKIALLVGYMALISLMKDQAEALLAKGIGAAYLDSSLNSNEYGKILYDTLNGRVKFLYVAPERLANQQFAAFAKRAHITLVAVDEAHCVSQWGHSFRKDYYNIPDFIALLPKHPLVAAFTATATEEVREDIVNRLNISGAKVIVWGG